MTDQLAITLTAATIGFLSAVFFCIGNALNTSEKILVQATPFYDFSEPLASSLAAQRAQYVVGALLLVIAFLLQVAAALASPTSLVDLPPFPHSWPAIILTVLLPIGALAGVASLLIFRTTMSKVKRLEAARRAKEEAEIQKRRSS